MSNMKPEKEEKDSGEFKLAVEPLEGWRRTRYFDEITDADFNTVQTVAGWVQDIRVLGSIAFFQLRDRTGVGQITLMKKPIGSAKFKAYCSLPRESVIMVKGKVQPNKEVTRGFEILPEQVKVLSIAAVPLPIGVIDKVNVDLDNRLDWRFIDLRKPEVTAVFKIRNTILDSIRETLSKNGFIEITTSKITATATEGGTELFEVKYFDKKAYLNQSPQLYKQTMMATGFDRVYEIGPAFRAEQHKTTRHLNEFTSIDIEMAFADEEDVMAMLEKVLYNCILAINTKNQKEMELLNMKLDVPALPFQRIEYGQCVEMAKAGGLNIEWGDDLSADAMKTIVDKLEPWYFITKWPTNIKPFYVAPFDDHPKVCRAFDCMWREKEITSGAQRVHNVSLLESRLREQGLDPESFRYYLQPFRYGMPPHAGWGLGAERLVMILTGVANVREAVLFPRDMTRLIP